MNERSKMLPLALSGHEVENKKRQKNNWNKNTISGIQKIAKKKRERMISSFICLSHQNSGTESLLNAATYYPFLLCPFKQSKSRDWGFCSYFTALWVTLPMSSAFHLWSCPSEVCDLGGVEAWLSLAWERGKALPQVTQTIFFLYQHKNNGGAPKWNKDPADRRFCFSHVTWAPIKCRLLIGPMNAYILITFISRGSEDHRLPRWFFVFV